MWYNKIMNNICGTCGGYVGNFFYSGTGAVVCNCGLINPLRKAIISPVVAIEAFNG